MVSMMQLCYVYKCLVVLCCFLCFCVLLLDFVGMDGFVCLVLWYCLFVCVKNLREAVFERLKFSLCCVAISKVLIHVDMDGFVCFVLWYVISVICCV
jgi:hypothetical protein